MNQWEWRWYCALHQSCELVTVHYSIAPPGMADATSSTPKPRVFRPYVSFSRISNGPPSISYISCPVSRHNRLVCWQKPHGNRPRVRQFRCAGGSGSRLLPPLLPRQKKITQHTTSLPLGLLAPSRKQRVHIYSKKITASLSIHHKGWNLPQRRCLVGRCQ